jgi:U3 small nucleolar RNA-associated protein 21
VTWRAPFFLPSSSTKVPELLGVVGKSGEVHGKETKTTHSERSRIAKLQRRNGAGLPASQFTSLLHSGRQSGQFGTFVGFLKSLSPAKSDLEIRSLDPRPHGDSNELCDFVSILTAQVRARKDFELINAWMAVFLRAHADAVEEISGISDQNVGNLNDASVKLRAALAEWKVEQEREGKRLAELVGYCRGIVGFLRSNEIGPRF